MAELRLCLLNMRGTNTRKLDYVLEKIGWAKKDDYPHILVITETNLTEKNGSISSIKYQNSFNHHITFSQGKYYRTAIITRKELKVKVIDSFTYTQQRWSKPGKKKGDDRTVFGNSYEVSIGDKTTTIVSVYLCPDANKDAKNQLIEWINGIENKQDLKIVMGDFNQNFHSPKIRQTFYEKIINLSNVIKKNTRVTKKLVKGRTIRSGTTIDCCLVSKSIVTKRTKVSEISRKPTRNLMAMNFDHKLIEITVKIPVMKKWFKKIINVNAKRPDLVGNEKDEVKKWLMQSEFDDYDQLTKELIKKLDKIIPVRPEKSFEVKVSAFGTEEDPVVKKLLRRRSILTRKLGSKSRTVRKMSRIIKKARKTVRERFVRQQTERSCNKFNIHNFCQEINNGRQNSRQIVIRFENSTDQQTIEKITQHVIQRSSLVTEAEQKSAEFYLESWDDIDQEEEKWITDDREITWPQFEEFSDYFDPKKISTDANFIRLNHIEAIWPELKYKLNQILSGKPIQKYSNIDNRTTLTIIPKGTKTITSVDQCRPIGVKNSILCKYLLAKTAFHQIRDKIKPKLLQNLNFSLAGTNLATIKILDTINSLSLKNKKVLVLQIDMSNAFFTLNRKETIKYAREIGFHPKTVNFLEEFMDKPMTTVSCSMRNSEGKQIVGRDFTLQGGTPAGHIGSETLFILAIEKMMKGICAVKYMDDVNLIVSADTEAELEANARKIFSIVRNRAAKMKLKLNPNKTQIIRINNNLNIERIEGLQNNNLNTSGVFIGYQWSVNRKTINKNKCDMLSIEPTKKRIIKRLQAQIPKLIAVRNMTKFNSEGIKTRVILIKNYLVSQLAELPVILCYNSKFKNDENWVMENEIKDVLKVYFQMCRIALGLEKTTPREIINQIIGFDIFTFVQHQTINLFLKLKDDAKPSRNGKFKNTGNIYNFMMGSVKIWNKLERTDREFLLNQECKLERKKFLKKNRKICLKEEMWLKLTNKFRFKPFKKINPTK